MERIARIRVCHHLRRSEEVVLLRIVWKVVMVVEAELGRLWERRGRLLGLSRRCFKVDSGQGRLWKGLNRINIMCR